MFTPSPEIILILSAFQPYLSAPAFSKAVLLICGVIMTPGRRTVASALRAVGRDQESTFGKYHRLLSRDRWSPLLLSKVLLFMLLCAFVGPDRPLELVVDETLERRQGRKLAYKAWYRDPVRSTGAQTVTTPAIRWLCLCVLVTVPWSQRKWALPFCTVPCCSEKNCQDRRRLFRGSVGLVVDLLIKVRQWLGQERPIRLIGDGGFSQMELVEFCRSARIEQIGRLRLDAALHDEPAPQPQGKRGRKPLKGERQPSLKQRLADPNTEWRTVEVIGYGGEPQSIEVITGVSLWYVSGHAPVPLRWVLVKGKGDADRGAAFFSTDQDATPEQIVGCYAQRWNIEVFFEEVRAWLGFETQRGWSNQTSGRTTPCLFGIFSLIVLFGKQLFPDQIPVRQSAWYAKEDATFHDVLCAVREHLWLHNSKPTRIINKGRSLKIGNVYAIPSAVFETLRAVASYAG